MDDKDFLYVLPSFAVSIFSAGTKMVNNPLIQSRESIIKCYHQGLYHITSDDAADKIISSNEVRASSRFASYSIHKRAFFFAGIPEFDNVCVNGTAGKTLTAVRVKLPYEKLAEFDQRSINDGAISYKGDLSLEGATVEKVRLGLKEKDGQLMYEEITEEEFKNYEVNLSPEKNKIVQNNLSLKIRSLITGMRKEYEIFKENFNKFLNDEKSGIKLTKETRQELIEKNQDLFEHTTEIPVQEINNQEQIINMYNQIIATEDKNDIKSELLKGIVSKEITDINKGIPVNTTVASITPGMNEKQTYDAIYTNLCNGSIKECYELLDNPVILFTACRVYYQNKSDKQSGQNLNDPRSEFLNQEIQTYNDSIKNQEHRNDNIQI